LNLFEDRDEAAAAIFVFFDDRDDSFGVHSDWASCDGR
jgi:hypothetical protein